MLGLERKKAENPFNYTRDQQDAKKIALIEMKKLYPDVNTVHAEWVYDMCFNTDQEDLKKIMDRVDMPRRK
jgi:hypothetical protein